MIRPQPLVEQLLRETVPKAGRQTKLRLDINENLAGWAPALVRRLLSSITPGDLAAYPETHGLYAAIARRHQVTPGQVLVASGSELAIRYVFEAFLAPGSELLILEPSFAMFDVYGRLYGADVVKAHYNSRLELSAADVIARLTPKTRILAIANPNNPTGTSFSEPDLVAMIARAAASNCLVLIDEAYFYFSRQTMAPRLAEFDNLIVTRTFSKAFGLAGLRLGYALGAPAVIEAAQKVQPIDHASVVAAKFGEYAIDHEELAWDYGREVEAGKRYLVDALRTLGLPVVDTCANFILVELGPHRDRILAGLHERVLIGASVRLPFPNTYVKITVGPRAEMERFVQIVRPLVGSPAATMTP